MEKNLDITKPRYSEHILSVPWPFVVSRFHCTILHFMTSWHRRCNQNVSFCYMTWFSKWNMKINSKYVWLKFERENNREQNWNLISMVSVTTWCKKLVSFPEVTNMWWEIDYYFRDSNKFQSVCIVARDLLKMFCILPWHWLTFSTKE